MTFDEVLKHQILASLVKYGAAYLDMSSFLGSDGHADGPGNISVCFCWMKRNILTYGFSTPSSCIPCRSIT